MSQADLLAARPWRTVTFTTYSLSLAFFEGVVLESLLRGGGADVRILADVAGVRDCLGEQGARGAGREYLVEPVAVARGVFHPKIGVFEARDDAHLFVGSGNLTFAGWGGNFEMLEHLHPSFAASAFNDAADFFELMALGERVRHDAGGHCFQVASNLRRSVAGQTDNGAIRVLHSLERSLADQIVELAETLGGARSLLVVSPYWDTGAAVHGLCKRLGLNAFSAHSHPGGTARGSALNWPGLHPDRVVPVQLDLAEDDFRRLHAKAFEIICRRGRLLVTGSANASGAALDIGGNVEVCVARLQSGRLTGWEIQPSEQPESSEAEDTDEVQDEVPEYGVLRAELEGDTVKAWVLTPSMSGPAALYQMTGQGPTLLGPVILDAEGRFEAALPALELQAWNAARLVLRVETKEGLAAQGFLTVLAASRVMRQAGAIAPRLLALISGTETPADVAAILDWLNENPDRLIDPGAAACGGGEFSAPEFSEAMIDVGGLAETMTITASAEGGHGSGGEGWRRFIDQVLRALRAPKGAFADADSQDHDDEEEGDGEAGDRRAELARNFEAEAARTWAVTETVVSTLTHRDRAARYGMVAFDIIAYVCARIEPPERRALNWLQRVIGALTPASVPPERADDITACCMLLLQAGADPSSARGVRAMLQRLKLDIDASPPRSEFETRFIRASRADAVIAVLWKQVQTVRTCEELVGDYVAALRANAITPAAAQLKEIALDAWPVLLRAFEGGRYRREVILTDRHAEICPECRMALPTIEARKYRDRLVATATNCCRRVLVFRGAGGDD